ncbi:hypothetical protein TNCV_4619411 [Trichonephila clavipes]|nr:hypothetical protein TNCV_4619411 [Trichonephila clavipes]
MYFQGEVHHKDILIVRCSVSGGIFSVYRDRSPHTCTDRLKVQMPVLILLTPESTVPRTTLSTALIMKSMIRLTTSASTFKPLIIRNTFTFKSVELPCGLLLSEYLLLPLSSPSNFPADSR